MSTTANFQELNKFIQYHDFKVLANGDRQFNALVIYASRGNLDQINTDVQIAWSAGPHEGKVALTEQSNFTADDFHLDFFPSYQTYKFDAQRAALTISGTSTKMGNYTVTISPI